MSIRQIMKSGTIICTVPDERKAEAIKNATQGPVTPEVPASILQNHPDCQLFLDTARRTAWASRGENPRITWGAKGPFACFSIATVVSIPRSLTAVVSTRWRVVDLEAEIDFGVEDFCMVASEKTFNSILIRANTYFN